VAAQGRLQVPWEAVAELRRQPGTLPQPLPPGLLKHAEEQTVVGLAAVARALTGGSLAAVPFADWGVVAAPRYLGRQAMATALPRFLAEGAWGVSPHLIPHRLLHALSGTISHALQIHGPNFGVGGNPGSAAELLLAALSLLQCQRLPGVWAVFTQVEPEAELDAGGRLPPDTVCRSLALALIPPPPGWSDLTLRVAGEDRGAWGVGRGAIDRSDAPRPTRGPFRLEQLLSLLDQADTGLACAHDLPEGGRIIVGSGQRSAFSQRAAGRLDWLKADR
jgi:hypothetical protein